MAGPNPEQKMQYNAGTGLGEARACTPEASLKEAYDKAYREPTLDERRAEFVQRMEDVQGAFRRMTETTDPEVFAFRAARLHDSTRELNDAAYSLGYAAQKAATK